MLAGALDEKDNIGIITEATTQPDRFMNYYLEYDPNLQTAFGQWIPGGAAKYLNFTLQYIWNSN